MKEELLIKKLVLAKVMYLRGCDFARSKDVINRMLAIHAFDNVVEMILKILAEQKNLKSPKNKKDWPFYDLLKQIKDNARKMQLSGLHEQRNRIHHHADIPDIETVIKYQGYTDDFLKEIIKKELNIDYDALFLGELIKNKELNEMVKGAERAFARENYKEAIELCEKVLIKTIFSKTNFLKRLEK